MRKTKVKRGENLKSQKAITLIVLVVTIIVLLILAGISITMLSGDNGILKQAVKAKEETRAADVEENVELWKMEKRLYNSETTKTEKELLESFINDQKVYEEEIDKIHKTIVIGNKTISYKVEYEATGVYAVLYNDGSLIISNNREEIYEEEIVENGDFGNIKGNIYTNDSVPWKDLKTSIKKIYIINNIGNVDISGWFYNCANLEEIEGLSNVNTSQMIDMTSLFYGCKMLSNLDLSNFNTSNVTSMKSMFGYCQKLTSLDLTSFDTSKVTDMSQMFDKCA